MATINSIDTGKPIEVSAGGTGATTLTDHGVLFGSGTVAVTALAVGANDYLLKGNTGADPSWTKDLLLTSVGLTGDLKLTSQASSMYIAVNKVFHAFGTYNVFVGQQSGNLTLTIANAISNSALGFNTLDALTTGDRNSAFGNGSLAAVTTGIRNSALGFNGLGLMTSGGRNTTVGANVLVNLATGNGNTGIGTVNDGVSAEASGDAYTTSESYNIVIGNHGVIGDSNTIRIGTQGSTAGQQDTTYVAGIYNTAVGATAGVVLSDSTHQLGGIAGAAGTVLIGGTKPSFLAAGTANQVLTSDGAATPVWEYAHALPLELEAQIGTTYTLVLGDAGKLVTLTNASAITLTIPTKATVAFPIGTEVKLYNGGAGLVTVGGAGVTLNASGTKVKLTAQYSMAIITKIATDTWVLSGDTSIA